MTSRPPAFSCCILRVLACGDEEVIHIRPARADRLLLHAADRDDGPVEGERSGGCDAAAARHVATRAAARSRARTGRPADGPPTRPRSMSTSNGSSILASWSTRIPTIAFDGSSGLGDRPHGHVDGLLAPPERQSGRRRRASGGRSRARSSAGVLTGVPSTATITSPASSVAAAGTSGDTAVTSTPRGVATTS